MARRSRARAATRDDKRERILAGAIEAFSRAGFHRTRVSDVARAAGVADGTIYLYFRDKNELLEAIFASAMERFHQEGDDYVLSDADPVGQLRRLCEMQLRLLGQDRELAAVFQIDLRHSLAFLGEISRRTLRPHLDFIAEIVRSGQEDGAFEAELDPAVAAAMVFGVLDQLSTNWVLSRRNYRLEAQAETAAAFLLRALGSSDNTMASSQHK